MSRKLHNTFFALSISAVLLTAGLIAAQPIEGAAPPVIADAGAMARTVAGSTGGDAAAIERATLAHERAIEAHAEIFGEQLERSAGLGEAIGQGVAFSVEVATQSLMLASIDRLSALELDAIEAEADSDASPSHPVRKQQRSSRSRAMPYFSFASRG